MTAKLIMKTDTQNTIRDERMEALADGRPLVALDGGYSGLSNTPQIEAVGVSYDPELSKGGVFTDANKINGLPSPRLHGPVNITRMANFMDLRMAGFGGRTVRQAYLDGTFDQFIDDTKRRVAMRGPLDASMDGNTLPDDWRTLIDAMRIQLTINKALNPTVREFIYSVLDRPNATATEDVRELFPYAFEFVENDGEGQPVEMGEMRGGQVDYLTQKIRSTGLTWSLRKVLFDTTMDMAKVNEGIAYAENAKKDDTALAPIINFTYATAAKTAADATSGATREDLLWRTLSNAKEDVIARRDPVTDERLIPMGCTLLCHPVDAMHVMDVVNGFDGTSQNIQRRNALTYISRVIGYEGGRIRSRSKGLISYTDLTEKKAYLIVPNRRMIISRKRGLQLNIDTNPDVLKLAQQEMAWWYCEGEYNDGIGYFIQEITLPAW